VWWRVLKGVAGGSEGVRGIHKHTIPHAHTHTHTHTHTHIHTYYPSLEHSNWMCFLFVAHQKSRSVEKANRIHMIFSCTSSHIKRCVHACGWACVCACNIHASISFEFNDNFGAFVGVHMQIWEGVEGGGGDVAPPTAQSTAAKAQ